MFYLFYLLFSVCQCRYPFNFKLQPNDDYEIFNFTAKLDNFDNTVVS